MTAKSVAFLHPDLGIGGAEQLILNMAVSLQKRGYKVTIYTPFFDPNRCLEEAKNCDVQVRGNWFPRSIFGRMIAFCAFIRMLLCAIQVVLFAGSFDYYLIDQVSLPIPILRCRNRKVLFYCHFPDKLLSTNRKGCLMKAYRGVLDTAEEVTTGCAHTILVNSGFTLDVYKRAFKMLNSGKCCFGNKTPQILYPAIDESNFVKSKEFDPQRIAKLVQEQIGSDVKFTNETKVLTSLNRYERKKNINLALQAFAEYMKSTPSANAILIVAGGYDTRLLENVQHHLELVALAKQLKIKDKTVFLQSISNDERLGLLERTDILLYTPENEHFGIVPVEAMHLGCVLIACNSGGPLESVKDKQTGFLHPPDYKVWANQIKAILGRDSQLESVSLSKLKLAAKQRVQEHFTERVFGDQLVGYLESMNKVKQS